MVRQTRITPAILRTQTVGWLVQRYEDDKAIAAETDSRVKRTRSEKVMQLVRNELKRRGYAVEFLDMSDEEVDGAAFVLDVAAAGEEGAGAASVAEGPEAERACV
jgi:hypothetical protein